LGEVA
jgi:hypothetical protein